MLILDYPDWERPTLFEEFFPKSFFELTPELVEIDQLLNNPVFEEPIISKFNTLLGRPLHNFRADVEAHISCLKRLFRMRRSYLSSHSGTSTCCGYGIFAHNLRKAVRLLMG